MRYRSQQVAYWYFAAAMVLFGLQLVFGILSAAKYLGPDPLLYILPFDVTKVISHEPADRGVWPVSWGAPNVLVRRVAHRLYMCVALAYLHAGPVADHGGSGRRRVPFPLWQGTRFFEQPLPQKPLIVVVMLLFPVQHVDDDRRLPGPWNPEGVLLAGSHCQRAYCRDAVEFTTTRSASLSLVVPFNWGQGVGR